MTEREMTDAEREADDRHYWTPTRLIERIEMVDVRVDEVMGALQEEIDLLRRRIERLEAAHG